MTSNNKLMKSLVDTLITSTIAFAATNMDDILVMTVFYTQVNGAFRKKHIVAGQYLGFSALIAISLLGFFVGLIVPEARFFPRIRVSAPSIAEKRI